MLRLEKLHVAGFKSFGDTVEAVFPDGITAIVGPNGCGKSNIGDAINWVLGEQSARMLRGSSMQDVIFNGSDARKPVGMAEVSLHLRAPNGDASEPRRMVITRRLFRNGESEYLINGSKSRLRDIQDMLREERVGAQTYATIEQGRIEAILNAKPKDRRLIIEEAAGIAGFKHKRRLAELKLEATNANLLRVNDIVVEVARQINSLKRQAAKARRFSRLRDELRRKEAVRFLRRAQALDADLARLREGEALTREAEAEAAAGLAALEASLVEERLALEEAERRARAAADAVHQLDIDIDRKHSRVRSARERITASEESEARLDKEIAALDARRVEVGDEVAAHEQSRRSGEVELREAEERFEALRHEAAEAERQALSQRERVEALRRGLFEATNRLAELRNRHRAVAEALERARVHGERLAAERDGARTELETKGTEAADLGREADAHHRSVEDLQDAFRVAEEGLRAAKAALSADVEALGIARQQEKSASARLRTLEDVTTRFAGASDGVRMLLSQSESGGIGTLGVVADWVEAAPEFEEAAEAYLQNLLPAVIVADDADADRAARLLRDGGAGRTLLLSVSHPSGGLAVGFPANGHAPLPVELLEDPRVIGRLKDRIRVKAGDGFVTDRIGDAVLVDSLEAALELHRRHPAADYLTASGEVVYASGLVAAGGRHAGESGLLAHNRKMHEERAHLADAVALAGSLQSRVDSGRVEETRREDEVARLRAESEAAARRRVELQMRVQKTEEDRARVSRRVEVLGQEIEGLQADALRMDAEHGEAQRAVAFAEAAFAAQEREHHEEAARLDALQQALRTAGEAVATQRSETGARRQRLAAAEREIERLRATLAELEGRRAAASAGRAEAAARREEDLAVVAATEHDLAGDVAARQQADHTLAALEQENGERRAALQDRDIALRVARGSLDARREAARDAELSRIRAESDRAHLDDLCSQELGVSAAEAASLAGEETGWVAEMDAASLDAAIADLRGKIDAVGPVNLTAIEEFRTLEERHTFLTAQKKDLEDSITSLRESIRRINRESRERFLDVFDRVRSSYQEIFKVLFNGGRADLVLEDGEDVLECGIEMVAQPPGKRLGSVSLLSGGEKSMAAIALLFAIFRIQPSPFCLLDEVDAALDEANVGRFTRMLREYAHATQFVLITHNKRSMESANLLYGVTMEEPGVSRLVSLRL